jgi:hypothetical protein
MLFGTRHPRRFGTVTSVACTSTERVLKARADCQTARKYLAKVEDRKTMWQIFHAWVSKLRATHGDLRYALLKTRRWVGLLVHLMEFFVGVS